ncbi:hypothetical protein M758_5G026000 [Ceratodon purpureus]|uniref:Uncharacterized protein n=1 Tax=Ceratodon purpureus TaxID=3225 RepID=A0A8T0HXV2_CERPU|nr:hypothetical protein KC19_5G024400 [Ceratodon purpureus]KAG0615236.1 hypothetical protein M758_5G026000 [Ceratodon purpureus]
MSRKLSDINEVVELTMRMISQQDSNSISSITSTKWQRASTDSTHQYHHQNHHHIAIKSSQKSCNEVSILMMRAIISLSAEAQELITNKQQPPQMAKVGPPKVGHAHQGFCRDERDERDEWCLCSRHG